MDKKALTENIKELHQKLGRIIRSVDEDNEIPVIDVDLLLIYCRNSYEELLKLRQGLLSEKEKMKGQQPVSTVAEETEKAEKTSPEKTTENELPTTVSEIAPQPEVQEEVPEIKTTEQQGGIFHKAEYREPTVTVKKTIENKMPVTDEKEPLKNEQTEQEETFQKTEFRNPAVPVKETIENKMPVTDEKKPLKNEQLSNVSEKEVAVVSLPDIGKFIGINDKIIYVQQLFDGNADMYKAAIETINSIQNYEEVEQYLASKILDRFNWTEKNEIANRFIGAIRRRHNLD